eukprot:PITA_35438
MAGYPPPASSYRQIHHQIELQSQPSPPNPHLHTSLPSTAGDLGNNSYGYYHVFISHRGPDVKRTFASHLYRRFLLHGYRVFLDQQEWQEGDCITSQIESAIRTASVHVAIFSPGYAESSWCLNELLSMLDSGSTIIPVFYHVKPAQLRWTLGDGVYAEALKRLATKKTYDSLSREEKPRYDPATIERWRNALYRAAEISGFELEACNGDEGELVDKVVERVLKLLKKQRFNVAEYPMDLDKKVKELESIVVSQGQQSGKPRVVAIVGFGGIGKTTLAEEFFNKRSSNYRKSYFLSDVRENAARSSLRSLRKKILLDLTQLDLRIESVGEGIEVLKEQISSFHALIILDDVDNVNQLEALLPIQNVLHSDSLILITSRDRDVLRRSGIEDSSIYNLTGLNTQHSTDLFCLHAFRQPHALQGFEYLVEKFVEACDGLRLSLKMFGALLYGKDDKSYWQYQLDKLQVPTEIQQRLKISYDSLNREEQQIFLDIACFFIGEDRDMAIRIWDGSGWNGLWGFQSIQNKCLVELTSEKRIKMHDHLRDMGRDIAESLLPRRLWRPTDYIDLLQRSCVINETRGMVPKTDCVDSDEDIYTYSSSEMSWYQRSQELLGNFVMKLRNRLHNPRSRITGTRGFELLVTEGDHLKRILKRAHSPNFVWLRWYECPCSFLPSWMPMKNLRVLHVRGGNLKTLWEEESQAPLQLRELQLFTPLSSIPKSIGQLKHLERIILNYNVGVNLKKLPDEFCNLQSLKTLVFKKCSKMKSVPESFGNLISLQHIDLSESSEMKSLPESFGNLSNLQHIDLSACHNLERLPNSFGKLIGLKYLNLMDCSALTISSEAFGNISTLEYISLSFCEKIEVLPPQVVRQRSLEKLYLWGTNLKELPSAIGDMRYLEVLWLGSPFLQTLPPSLGDLSELKKLEFGHCKNLRYLPASVALLTQLTDLRVFDCPLRKLPFGNVTGGIASSGTVSNLDSSTDNCMPRLQYLSLSNTEVSELSFAEGVCRNLQRLQVYCCDHLRLDISWCKEIELPPSIETLVSLEALRASRCVKLKNLRNLAQLTKLRLLDVCQCCEIEELEGVEHCISLERLNAVGRPKLQWCGALEQLQRQLKDLKI